MQCISQIKLWHVHPCWYLTMEIIYGNSVDDA